MPPLDEDIDRCTMHYTEGCGNTMPDLSDLGPLHSGQVLLACPGTSLKNLMQFCISFLINCYEFTKLCCMENSVDPDQLASEEAS